MVLWNAGSDPLGLGQGPRICIPNKLPGDAAAAAGPRTPTLSGQGPPRTNHNTIGRLGE